tara:strand:- start:1131 stop:3647 length:2517 start_codon:yes stop_codon:yes gene_type:complete
MAERIVSPGVFTREKDLSFLPAGIGAIGAAIIGPTRKGPSFIPTVVSNFAQFEEIFGGFDENYYTPYAVREYLSAPGAVTIVKVGYVGGYYAPSLNLVVTDSGTSFPATVVATFAPSAGNGSGVGGMTGSIDTAVGPAGAFDITLSGSNGAASLTGQAIIGGTGITGQLFSDVIGTEPSAPSIGASDAPMYLYKDFRSSMSASAAGSVPRIDAESVITLEMQAAGLDFSGGTNSVNSTTYVTTLGGNVDAQAARTPMIHSQAPATDLFRIYMRVDGAESNDYYTVISDVKKPQNSNTSPDYAQFSLAVYPKAGSGAIQSWSSLNLDPDSSNYLPKVIGDQFQTVTSAGVVETHGEYQNNSRLVRVGDYDEKTFTGNPNLQPMGYAAVLEPIISTAAVPTASFNFTQKKTTDADTQTNYKADVPYGFKIGDHFNDDELHTNYAYMSAIPNSAGVGNNVAFSLENMHGYGFSDDGVHNAKHGSSFLTRGLIADAGASPLFPTMNIATLSISASAVQLKYAIPFQYGFDGKNPSITPKTGGDISATNTMGFDCSSALTSGSIAYKKAINTVSNPDEIDINMLVTPGIIHSLHPVVSTHALDMVEDRADAFYVLDTSAWNDNVSTAVSNVSSLDSNYAATYFPWVKINVGSAKGTWVPPSVVIPGVISYTDSVAHEWFAPAGLTRGGLGSVSVAKSKLTHTDRDTLYEARINPIATFPNQGVVVFGQKTLQAKPSALDRINVRRLLIKLKKFIASSSRFLVFEQNNSSTRARFLNIVNPFLESVQSNSGLSAFKVVMDDSNNTPDVIDRNQLVGQIFIQPTRTAEFIVLDFSVLPTGATFPE